ncbi:MAG: sigma-E factor negative regulatory protein [Gammaproteobacteria bacterium]|nr:sigma-E factor negative regulatory protein [Gammaproteobacteria bacterium]
MSDPNHEWISAYLDDELTPAERARGGRDLSRQPEARRRLGRYQLIGDAMRGDLPDHLELGLASRVHQKIVQEVSSPPKHHTLQELWHWIRHPAPLAVATGMLATLVAVGLWFYTKEPETVPVVVDVPIDHIAQVPETEIDAKEHHQIMSYLTAHAEVESRALMPYVQLVEYDK